ncbi:MAG: HAD family phosphatase [Deltaproteobacteria bacterium]|nr:HAD family phosphatase [Deltaproteobacteria bacterium]MBW2445524.1 HAD family phosphatase [Deltaproteobacteria bacterium]
MDDPAARPFEAVLFDFGGVFIDSPFPAFAASSLELGLDASRLMELTFGPLDEDTDHPWHRVERGELPILDARKEIIALCQAEDLEVDPFRLLARTMGAQTQARSPVVDCVHAIRSAGLKTGLLTNNALEIRERWRAVLPLADLFDDVVDSSEVGVRKPDPAIYHLALERLGGVDASSAIFLDDLPGNVEAAEALGMRGILVEPDPALALVELRSLVLSSAG